MPSLCAISCNHRSAKRRSEQGNRARFSKQREIVAKLDALAVETKRLESIYQQKLAALEALRKSLLHQAFSGQL